MKTAILSTDIGDLTLRPILIDGMFNEILEGVEIKNEEGETVEIEGYRINEITPKTATKRKK